MDERIPKKLFKICRRRSGISTGKFKDWSVEKMTNKEFLRKFDTHEKFTKGEIKEMCWGEVGEVLKENIVDTDRWTISKELIFEVNSRFFSVFWTEGATEEQDGCKEYPDYPTEVRRVEKITYDYVPIEEGD